MGISRIEALEPSPNGRRGEVTWYRRVFNQEGRLVQEGRTKTLVRGRSRQVPEDPTKSRRFAASRGVADTRLGLEDLILTLSSVPSIPIEQPFARFCAFLSLPAVARIRA